MGGKLGWRVLGMAAAIGSGVLARKLMTSTWKIVTGDEPPSNPEHPDTTWQEAFGWAVASGAAVGIARLLATRKAADYYRRSTGHLPPGLEEVSA